MFLTDQRVLTILVFDLRQELDSPALVPEYRTDPVTGALVVETRESELTHLDFILLWLELVSLAGRGRASAQEQLDEVSKRQALLDRFRCKDPLPLPPYRHP